MHLPRDPLGAQRQTAAIARIREYLKGHVEQHRATFDADNIRDYYDSFLHEMQRRESSGKPHFFSGMHNILLWNFK